MIHHISNKWVLILKQEFTTFDIIKRLQIPRERLREWMKRGFIEPTTSASGVGTKAVFTLQDVYKILLFKHLIEIGFMREVAADFIRNLDLVELLSGDYIGFRVGKDKVPWSNTNVVYFFMNRHQVLQISDGMPAGWYNIRNKVKKFASEHEYDDLIIVNYKKIRQRVNAALS